MNTRGPDPTRRGVIIIGGGLSGLIAAIELIRAGIPVTVFERKQYPFHRVCGEYISNETVPFLRSLGLFPEAWNPPVITRLRLTSVNGRSAEVPLDLGGFGISRYVFDNFIYEKARGEGVHFVLGNEVTGVLFRDDRFEVTVNQKVYESSVVLGAFGKRSRIDHALKRDFIQKRSPYVGVKYHIRTEHPSSLISLHNFEQGYCGLSRIEDHKSNLCYLTHRDNVKIHGSIETMEKEVLFRNPFLKSIFQNSDFVLKRPEVINEISFERKLPVEQHMLMIGDAAGMITPLCGNGMAMAIHSAKISIAWVLKYMSGNIDRQQMELGYTREWENRFARRLWVGRQVQRLFGGVTASNVAVTLARHAMIITRFLVRQTHGDPF